MKEDHDVILAVVTASTTRPGKLSLRLRSGDPDVHALLDEFTGKFLPGDLVEIRRAPADKLAPGVTDEEQAAVVGRIDVLPVDDDWTKHRRDQAQIDAQVAAGQVLAEQAQEAARRALRKPWRDER